MSREWFGAASLAGLPALPATESAVIRRAKRETWQFRKRSFGKGFEYHVKSLPEEARIALQLKAIGAPIPRHLANPRINATRVRSAAKTLQEMCQAQRKQIDYMEALADTLLAVLDDSDDAGDQS